MAGEARLEQSARVPALDGLRGLAVAAVVCFHGELGFADGGFLGVSSFFTLSGFLITTLLLLEWERTGRIDLWAFWGRRARRLLPAALVALAGIALYTAFLANRSTAPAIGGDGISALFYVANWRFIFTSQSYAAVFSDPSPVQHFWSLAIEEQFYLIFPLLAIGILAVTRSRYRFRAALIGLSVASVVATWLLWSPGEDPARVYYGTDTRAAELLIGAAFAAGIAGRRRLRIRWRRIGAAIAGAVALLGLVALWATVERSDAFLYRGGLALNAILTVTVISGALHAGPLRQVLGWRPLRALGLISYGVYLYHWPIFLWLDADTVGVDGAGLFLVRITVTLAAAVVSYHYLEQPIRTRRAVIGRRPRFVLPAAITTVVAMLAIGPSLSAPAPIDFAAVRDPSRAGVRTSAARPALVRSVTAPEEDLDAGPLQANGPTTPLQPPATVASEIRRVLVVGDSVAITAGRGLERWGPAHGIEVVNAARLWCPLTRGGNLAAHTGRAVEGCADWPEIWSEQIRTTEPDLVVVLTTVWDLTARRHPFWGDAYLSPGDRPFDDLVKSEWAFAARTFGQTGARVVWLTPPCASSYDLNRRLRYARRHYLDGVRAEGASVIDLDRAICPGGEYRDSVGDVDNIRPDGLHFSDLGADLLAEWLGPRLLAVPATGSTAPLGQK